MGSRSGVQSSNCLRQRQASYITCNVTTNPPAPKVPRRGSLAVRDVTDLFNGYSFTRRLWQFAAISRRSAQHRANAPFRKFRPHMSATSVPLGASMGQHGPNLGPTRNHLTPTSAWAQLSPSWVRLGATSAQVEAHMASKWGTWPA